MGGTLFIYVVCNFTSTNNDEARVPEVNEHGDARGENSAQSRACVRAYVSAQKEGEDAWVRRTPPHTPHDAVYCGLGTKKKHSSSLDDDV